MHYTGRRRPTTQAGAASPSRKAMSHSVTADTANVKPTPRTPDFSLDVAMRVHLLRSTEGEQVMSQRQQKRQEEILEVLDGWIARGEASGIVVSLVPSNSNIGTQVWSSVHGGDTLKALRDAKRVVLLAS